MTDNQPGDAEFAEWWPVGRERWISESMSTHEFVRQAFLAGVAARNAQLARAAYTPDSEKDAARARLLSRYSPPRPMFRADRDDFVVTNLTPDGHPGDGSADYMPAPDYTQKGTVTGRIPRPDGPITRENVMLQAGSAPRLDQREPVDYAAKMRRFHEVYGVGPEKVKPVDPATLERVHTELTRDGVVEYPTEASRPPQVGLEHTETVWDGDTTMQFGATGPVPTIPGLQEDDNASS